MLFRVIDEHQLGIPGKSVEHVLLFVDALEVGEAAPELDEATRERLRQLGYLE
jgi:hypothetical protein